jgi:hypothetical protein
VGRAADVLRLVRAPLAPTAACDAVACALLARGAGLASGGGPPALAVPEALLIAATSVLVYAAGMAGNDLFDLRRDRTIAPDRPLPSGRLSKTFATVLVLACAAGAVLLHGGPAGHVVPVAAALLFALLYDAFHARFPLASAPLMGLVRFSNAAIGVWALVIAGTVSPLALWGPALLGAYSTGVTMLSTAEGRPQVPFARGLAARALAFAAFAGAGALSVVAAESLTFGMVFAGAACLSIAFGRVPRRGPVKKQVLEMLLGLYWVDMVLVTGARPGQDWLFAVVALAAAYALIMGSQLAIRALRPR